MACNNLIDYLLLEVFIGIAKCFTSCSTIYCQVWLKDHKISKLATPFLEIKPCVYLCSLYAVIVKVNKQNKLPHINQGHHAKKAFV